MSEATARPAPPSKLHAARALKLRLQRVEELVLLPPLPAATIRTTHRRAARRAARRRAVARRAARLRHCRRRLPLRCRAATGPLPLRHPALGVVVVGVAVLVEQLLPA